MTDQTARPTADDYVRATALAVGVDPEAAVAYREATEHHTGTLNLTGEGNAPAQVVSNEIVQLAERAYEAFGAGMQDALEAAYPAIRQQVAEEIAVKADEIARGHSKSAADHRAIALEHGLRLPKGKSHINTAHAFRHKADGAYEVAQAAREIGGVA